MTRAQTPHIGIIGAGVAGLRCARILLDKGYKVTVLEARDRVGGRLCQAKVGGHTVDLGPNWIHGTKNNPILDLVDQTGTVKHDFGERQASWDQDGHALSPAETAENSEILWEIIGEAFKFSQKSSGDIDKNASLMDYVKARVDERFGKGDPKKAKLICAAAETWGLFIGGQTKTQSLKFLWLEESLEGDNLFCAGTYEKVLNVIAEPVVKAQLIKFEHIVEGITSTKVRSGRNSPSLSVRLRDGRSLGFDELVVTTPLGWLKRNLKAFEPALPTRFAEAVKDVGYGNLDKVMITFPTAFWQDSTPKTEVNGSNGTHSNDGRMRKPDVAPPNQKMMATPLPKNETNGQKSSTNSEGLSTSVQATLSNRGRSFPGFANFYSPTYTSENPRHWSQEFMNLAAMPASVAHPTLLFYTSGPTSTHIASLLRKHTDPTQRKQALYTFFLPYIRLLPNYSPTNPNCQMTDILATGWENDEFSGYGSYSNFPTGTERLDEDVRVLREGCTERGLWFAGEHTAPYEGLGTVTGAWWSGEKVAGRICDMLGGRS